MSLMARADDARCLFCDGKLPLFRKLTNGQFCSKEHQKAYWKEQERLAVEVLHRTHDALMAYKPPGDIELIIGPPVEWNAESETIEAPIPTVFESAWEPEAVLEPSSEPIPLPLVEAVEPEAVVPFAGFLALEASAAPGEIGLMASPDPLPYPLLGERCDLDSILRDCQVYAEDYEARALPIPHPCEALLRLDAGRPAQPGPVERDLSAVAAISARLSAPVVTGSGLELESLNWSEIREQATAEEAAWLAAQAPPEPESPPQAAWLPMAFTVTGRDVESRIMARSEPQAAAAVVSLRKQLLEVPPQVLLPNVAGIARFPLRSQDIRLELAGSGPGLFHAMVSYPGLPAELWQQAAGAIGVPRAAGPSKLDRLRTSTPLCRLEKADQPPNRYGSATFPTRAFVAGLDLPPQAWPTAPAPSRDPIASAREVESGIIEPPRATGLKRAGGIWKPGRRELRLLVLAVPVVLAAAFYPGFPKTHNTPVEASSVEASTFEKSGGTDKASGSTPVARQGATAETKPTNGWENFKQAVSERAAVALDEDFRQGLDDWISPGGTATEWSFDSNGFVRPGSLAIYGPSVGLSDYQAQFLALIDKKALSWVVRAADFENYYVVKLVVLKPGPMTTLGLTRYAVINGQPQDRRDTPVPVSARPDMIYRVRMDVSDDNFSLTVQGQMIDAWAEPRLKKGGIGFFSARGEESRVRWLQVTHQYDMLGRLCAYLAPYDMSSTGVLSTDARTNTEGSWK
jgi:hypothetical protein